MAFNAKQLIVESEVKSTSAELTPQEIEFLLLLLRNVDLKGFQVELFYNLAIKLQNLYIQKSNK
jgi:hypothetical protein